MIGEVGAWRQLLAVMRMEWRRQLRGPRLLLLAGLALLPIGVALGMALAPIDLGWRSSVPAAREAFAHLYHALVIGVALYFGCLALFLNLIRGEVEGRTLHYYFLAPLRRPLVVLGKYLATVTVAWGIFLPATALSLVAIYSPVAVGQTLPPMAVRDLLAYGGMTVLGCLAYGAIFLALGTLLRSPGLVVALYFVWDWFQYLLPPVLKHLSVVHYLKALAPVPISQGPFVLLADPTSPWLAATRLLVFSAVAVAVSMAAVRKMEIAYGTG